MLRLKSQAFKWLDIFRIQEFISISDTDLDQDPYCLIKRAVIQISMKLLFAPKDSANIL